MKSSFLYLLILYHSSSYVRRAERLPSCENEHQTSSNHNPRPPDLDDQEAALSQPTTYKYKTEHSATKPHKRAPTIYSYVERRTNLPTALFTTTMADNPQQATKTTKIDSGSSKGVATDDKLCLKCQEKPITYECDPCGCHAFCTGCARKLGTHVYYFVASA